MDQSQLIAYLSGALDVAEKQAVEAWIDADPEHAKLYRRTKALWEASKPENIEAPDVDLAWQQVRARVQTGS